MQKVYALLLVIILFISIGCSSTFLEVKWRPLKEVTQSWIYPSDVMVTIGSTLYTDDLEGWKKAHPVGSISREYILRHERVHSFRQAKYGLTKYISKYATDGEFRWREEKLAAYVAISYLVSKGRTINIKRQASFLSGPAYCNMTTYKEAEIFLVAVIAKKYIPDGELPPKIK